MHNKLTLLWYAVITMEPWRDDRQTQGHYFNDVLYTATETSQGHPTKLLYSNLCLVEAAEDR